MKINQHSQILEHIKNYGYITFAIAFTDYGIANLKGRIHELRRIGYNIESEHVNFCTRLGKKSRYVKYILLDK